MKMFIITLLFGWLGVHRFMRGQTGLGILYLFTFGIFGVGWTVDTIIAFKNMRKEQQPVQLNFDVQSWGEYTNNITRWQKENARDQWINANLTSKELYQYSWMNDIEDIYLKPEPNNEHDVKAIEVYLGIYKIGYVPQPFNEQYYNRLINVKNIKADIRSGDSKHMDEYGDTILNKRNPVVEISLLI